MITVTVSTLISSSMSTMPGRGKKNKGDWRGTCKSPCRVITSPRVAQAGLRAYYSSQERPSTPKIPQLPMEALELLLDISSRCQATELFMQEAQWDKAADAARRRLTPTQSRQSYHDSRWQAWANSNQPHLSPAGMSHATAELSQAIREKVSMRMQQFPILEISSFEDDTNAAEGCRPPERGGIDLSNQIKTAQPTRWYYAKNTMPHELVYTSEGQPSAYNDLSVDATVHQQLSFHDGVRKGSHQTTHGMLFAVAHG